MARKAPLDWPDTNIALAPVKAVVISAVLNASFFSGSLRSEQSDVGDHQPRTEAVSSFYQKVHAIRGRLARIDGMVCKKEEELGLPE